MSGQPTLGALRCLEAKKAVKLEKSLSAQLKGINSNQSWGGGWGAFFSFVCLFVFRCFLFLKHCAGFQKEQRVESHSVLCGEVWLLACCDGSAVFATIADVSS